MNEAAIQRKIIERYTKKGYLCIKLLQTTLNGIPDLMCLRGGKAIFIEVKRPGGRIEPLQVYRNQQLSELGFLTFITDNHLFDHEKPDHGRQAPKSTTDHRKATMSPDLPRVGKRKTKRRAPDDPKNQ